jgi:hypothetical protein
LESIVTGTMNDQAAEQAPARAGARRHSAAVCRGAIRSSM